MWYCFKFYRGYNENIGRIAYPGMMETDKEILNIMIESSK